MKHELPETEPVVLHDLFGMRPGKVIFIGLIILILLLIFLLCFLPGIVKGGRYVAFSSPFSSVAVLTDGKYLSSTDGSRVFLSSGEHELVYVKDGVEVGRENIRIDHPVFFTLFVRRSLDHEIAITATEDIYKRAYERAIQDAVHYSAVLDYDEFYNYRPLITAFAKDAIASGRRDVSDEIFTLASFVTSQVMLDDLEMAIGLLEEAGVTHESAQLDSLLAEIPDILVSSGSWNLTRSNIKQVPSLTSDGFYEYDDTLFTIGESTEKSIQGAAIKPVTVEVEEFEIKGHPVSEYEYALFVQENPKWAKTNASALIEEGLVDEHYLDGIYLTTVTRSERPVRNISFHASSAYIDWLNSRSDEYEYFLPSEAEFEVAALSADSRSYQLSLISTDTDTSTPSSLLGGLWEFTRDHYVPLSRVTDGYRDLISLDEADVIIKGGSYVNDPARVTAQTTGVMAKDTCSEYTGMRIARRER